MGGVNASGVNVFLGGHTTLGSYAPHCWVHCHPWGHTGGGGHGSSSSSAAYSSASFSLWRDTFCFERERNSF